jgi:hypothetical protein
MEERPLTEALNVVEEWPFMAASNRFLDEGLQPQRNSPFELIQKLNGVAHSSPILA